LSRVLGEVFGVPPGAAGKADINGIEDAGLLEKELAR
jgi:hypothetical protein